MTNNGKILAATTGEEISVTVTREEIFFILLDGLSELRSSAKTSAGGGQELLKKYIGP